MAEQVGDVLVVESIGGTALGDSVDDLGDRQWTVGEEEAAENSTPHVDVAARQAGSRT